MQESMEECYLQYSRRIVQRQLVAAVYKWFDHISLKKNSCCKTRKGIGGTQTKIGNEGRGECKADWIARACTGSLGTTTSSMYSEEQVPSRGKLAQPHILRGVSQAALDMGRPEYSLLLRTPFAGLTCVHTRGLWLSLVEANLSHLLAGFPMTWAEPVIKVVKQVVFQNFVIGGRKHLSLELDSTLHTARQVESAAKEQVRGWWKEGHWEATAGLEGTRAKLTMGSLAKVRAVEPSITWGMAGDTELIRCWTQAWGILMAMQTWGWAEKGREEAQGLVREGVLATGARRSGCPRS